MMCMTAAISRITTVASFTALERSGAGMPVDKQYYLTWFFDAAYLDLIKTTVLVDSHASIYASIYVPQDVLVRTRTIW